MVLSKTFLCVRFVAVLSTDRNLFYSIAGLAMRHYFKVVSILLALLVSTSFANGETPPEAQEAFLQLKKQIEAHYFSYDEGAHRQLLGRANGFVKHYPEAWHAHYYAALINIQLGNIVRADRKAEAYRYYHSALRHAQSAHEIAGNAETTVVLAAAYGKLASLRTLKMFYFGAKSKNTMIEAFKMNDHSPKSHLIIGVHTMWTPTVFGGSNDTAREFLEKALALGLDWSENDPLVVRWATSPEILAHLAQLEIFCGAPERAWDYVNAVMALVPQYGFVTRDILPQLNETEAGG
jgi:hypothetical protein